MLTQQAIIDFCNQYDYDIRKSHNGRWIDQKCAADVVTVIADCIYNYALEDDDGIFTTADIWHYKYAVENVEAIFKKPGVENEAARSEYDKFFQQPMEMLANARILTKTKQGNRNFYRVNNFEVLEYIALRERNALFFLKAYGYILSLINDYDFEVQTYVGYTTADVFPPEVEVVENHLRRHLMNKRLPNSQINACVDNFIAGYNL